MDFNIENSMEQSDLDAAQTVIEADKRRRIAECGKELNILLEKYKCSINSQQILVNGIPNGPAQLVIVTR